MTAEATVKCVQYLLDLVTNSGIFHLMLAFQTSKMQLLWVMAISTQTSKPCRQLWQSEMQLFEWAVEMLAHKLSKENSKQCTEPAHKNEYTSST